MNVDLSSIQPHLLGTFLVFVRLAAVFMLLPGFGSTVVPARFKLAMAVVLSLFWHRETATQEGLPVGAIAANFLLGAAMGLVLRTIVAGAELAGEMMGVQMGFGFGRTVDPLSGEQGGVIRNLITMSSGALFFATGSHHLVLRGFDAALSRFPLQARFAAGDWATLLVRAGETLFVTGVRLAIPVSACVLVSQLGFALLARIAPQLNVWGIGFLASVGTGVITLSIYIQNLNSELAELWRAGLEQWDAILR